MIEEKQPGGRQGERPRLLGGLLMAMFGSLLLVHCMGETQEEGGGAPVTIPHPPGWVNGASHGPAYVADKGSCATSCHGTDLKGGFSGISCFACHPLYPHPADWVGTAQPHGDASRQPGALAQCAACHGADFQGGISGVSCLTCHATYPHPVGWEDPKSHGLTALAAGVQAACGNACHGTDYSGGLVGVSCFSCHASFPHPSGWADYTQHGAAAIPSASRSCDATCHGTDFTGGDSGVSCFECHARYPHVSWAPFDEHEEWVATLGDASCITAAGCHFRFRGPANIAAGCTNFCHRLPPAAGVP